MSDSSIALDTQVNTPLDTHVGSILQRARRIAQVCRQAVRERDEARREVADLHEQVDSLKRRLEAAERENAFMKMGAALAPSREERLRTRTVVAGLIREIDKCIADLGEAPQLTPQAPITAGEPEQ